MGIPVRPGTLQHFRLHLLQYLSRLRLQFVQRYLNLLPRITAADHTPVRLDVLRPDLHTDRNSPHLLLGELPAGTLIRIVHFHPKAAKPVSQLVSLIQHAFFFLLNRNDHDLYRCDPGRQYQARVVAVYHDQRTDQARGCAP